jgi:hypothetical protein
MSASAGTRIHVATGTRRPTVSVALGAAAPTRPDRTAMATAESLAGRGARLAVGGVLLAILVAIGTAITPVPSWHPSIAAAGPAPVSPVSASAHP